MVVQSASELAANANSYDTCRVGMCLMYTRTWFEIGSRDYSAAEAWNNAARRHPGDRNPPKGAPCFWLGGSRGLGHIAPTVTSNVGIRSTDVMTSGRVQTVPLSWFDQHWSSLHYVGWTEDLNGMVIPYLVHEQSDSRWATGDVYVSKLHEGQKDSDSVARLCYRLVTHNKMPASHRPLRIWRNYNDDVVEAVRYWQRNIYPDKKDGTNDGTHMGNPQANYLFGDNYTVHNKK